MAGDYERSPNTYERFPVVFVGFRLDDVMFIYDDVIARAMTSRLLEILVPGFSGGILEPTHHVM